MNHLPFSHPAITPKILQRIFCKATKLSAIRLTQTGKLGRDTFNMARLDLLEAFQTLEDHYKQHDWLPRNLRSAGALRRKLDIECSKHDNRSNTLYTYVNYLELVADYMNLLLSCTISLQRFMVFYYPHLESSLFRNSSGLAIFCIILLSVLLSLAHITSDCFFQFSQVFQYYRWEFICGYSNGPVTVNGNAPNATRSAVAYTVCFSISLFCLMFWALMRQTVQLYLIIKASLPLITVLCYFLIFIKMLRRVANQTHSSEYMQLVQSLVIFVMFQISTWFSIYVFNLEMTPTGAFYAKRIVDMGAATLPVIFLLCTNKEILTAMGLRKLSDRITNVRPGQLHSRRVSAVVPTATVQ